MTSVSEAICAPLSRPVDRDDMKRFLASSAILVVFTGFALALLPRSTARAATNDMVTICAVPPEAPDFALPTGTLTIHSSELSAVQARLAALGRLC